MTFLTKIRQTAQRFASSESGAVTVDWVVLTASICTLGFVVAYGVAEASMDQTSGIAARVDSYTIPTYDD